MGLREDPHLNPPATTVFDRGGVHTLHARRTLAFCQVGWAVSYDEVKALWNLTKLGTRVTPGLLLLSNSPRCSLSQLLHPLVNAGKIPLNCGQVFTHSCLHLGQESGIVLKGTGNHLLSSV